MFVSSLNVYVYRGRHAGSNFEMRTIARKLQLCGSGLKLDEFMYIKKQQPGVDSLHNIIQTI